jgi:hypothetical protein
MPQLILIWLSLQRMGVLPSDTGQFSYPQGLHKLEQRVLPRLPDHIENTRLLPKSEAAFFCLPIEDAELLT